MHKSQLLLALFLVLGLVFSSVDALPCRYCDRQTCLSNCTSALKDCYAYQKEHKTKEACLSYYYICNATCSVAPRSIGVESSSSNDTRTPTSAPKPTPAPTVSA